MLRKAIPILWFVAAVIPILVGCTIISKPKAAQSEDMLVAAGFEVKTADTPQAIEKLKALPQRKFIRHQVDGEFHYLYADTSHCQCLYTGTEKDFLAYEQLVRERRVQHEEELYEQQNEDRPPVLDWAGTVDRWW